MPGLIADLKDPMREVRLNVLVSLRKIGPNAAAQIPALNRLLKVEDQELNSAAAKTLEAVGAKEKK